MRHPRTLLRLALPGLALLVIAAVAYPYVVGDIEIRPLDDAARAAMTNERFVLLSDGMVRYEWAGPDDGERVVLVHGFSSPCLIWGPTFHALADAGFRVLRYDLYGRGHSDRPDTEYGPDLYVRQLCELLDSQGIDKPIDVVGLSMGGAITVLFTDRYPERVRRFALFAPAGFRLDVPAAAALLRLPGVGEWVFKVFGDHVMLGSIERQISRDGGKAAEFRRMYLDQMQYAGYKRALLSTLRHMPLMDLGDVYQRVGASGKPCALFWGTSDAVVPFAHHKLVQKAVPQIEFHVIEGGSHVVPYEFADVSNPNLIAFLRQKAG